MRPNPLVLCQFPSSDPNIINHAAHETKCVGPLLISELRPKHYQPCRPWDQTHWSSVNFWAPTQTLSTMPPMRPNPLVLCQFLSSDPNIINHAAHETKPIGPLSISELRPKHYQPCRPWDQMRWSSVNFRAPTQTLSTMPPMRPNPLVLCQFPSSDPNIINHAEHQTKPIGPLSISELRPKHYSDQFTCAPLMSSNQGRPSD